MINFVVKSVPIAGLVPINAGTYVFYYFILDIPRMVWYTFSIAFIAVPSDHMLTSKC